MGGDVDWSYADHMWSKHQVTPAMASEALTDPLRVEMRPDPASRSGVSDRTIGWSMTAQDLVVVITVTDADMTFGVNGWFANPTARRIYNDEELSDE